MRVLEKEAEAFEKDRVDRSLVKNSEQLFTRIRYAGVHNYILCGTSQMICALGYLGSVAYKLFDDLMQGTRLQARLPMAKT